MTSSESDFHVKQHHERVTFTWKGMFVSTYGVQDVTQEYPTGHWVSDTLSGREGGIPSAPKPCVTGPFRPLNARRREEKAEGYAWTIPGEPRQGGRDKSAPKPCVTDRPRIPHRALSVRYLVRQGGIPSAPKPCVTDPFRPFGTCALKKQKDLP